MTGLLNDQHDNDGAKSRLRRVHDHFVGVDAFVLVAGLAWLCVRQSD